MPKVSQFATAIVLHLTLVHSSLAGPADKDPQKLMVGFAERDISPRLGMERPGNYFKQYHTDFHDSCKVRAVVLSNGQQSVAIVSVDALVICEQQVALARKAIANTIGIDARSILIAATHSHSSGPTGMLLPGQFDHADDFIQKLAYEESTLADPEYLHHLVSQIVDAVSSAYQDSTQSRIGFGCGAVEGITFNRRFRMKSGVTQTMPRPGNPGILEPAGPTDPDLGVIGVWSMDGNLKGCILNFACHASAAPPAISANYIYYVEQQLRNALGEKVVLVFLAAASGDINTTDNQSPYKRVTGESAGKLLGSQLSAEAVKQLLLMGTTDQITLAANTKEWLIARRVPSPTRVAEALDIVRDKPKTSTEWIFAKETLLADSLAKHEPSARVEVQAVQVGPAVFVTTPCEYFCQFGLDQKRSIRFPFTFPVSLANGSLGYVPTEEAFSKHGGGYETRLTSYSNLVPSAGREMADAGIKLANGFHPDSVPEPEKAPAFTEAWPYGAIPAQTE